MSKSVRKIELKDKLTLEQNNLQSMQMRHFKKVHGKVGIVVQGAKVSTWDTHISYHFMPLLL